jgi:IclR family acetate operon transcriptional repressor
MAEFRDRVGETINLGRFDGYNVIYLSSFESGKNLRKYTRIGRSVPAYANAMGKILLSNLNATTIEQIYTKPFDRFTAKTVKDLESLEKEINKTKKDGWAIEHEQSSVGFSCIAVAIHDQFPPINALSVSTRTKLLDQAKIDVLLPELFDAAQRIQDGGALRHIG